MTPSDMPVVEWRVCCAVLAGKRSGWRVTVHCRSKYAGQEPGPWRLVREVEFHLPSGQIRHDYWKDMIRAIAK